MINTKLIKMEENEAFALEMASKIWKDGGLVAFPTETVYGLGANGLDEQAAVKIYAAKGRPSDNPLIVHIAEYEDLKKVAVNIPAETDMLAAHFWPGPLTMIFEKSSAVPYETTGGLESVAVRMPSHPVAMALIKEGGGYVAAPSANTSGRPSPTQAPHVREDLEGKIDMIIDGGSVGIGLESTIVDFTEAEPVILRPGYINQEMIEKVIGKVKMDKGLLITDEKVRPKAPGMKYRHYAPKADLKIVEGPMEKVIAYINEKASEKKRPGIICTEETRSRYLYGDVKCIGSRTDENAIASHLFAILREFDEDGVDAIYSESFESPGLGQAIMNRLLKAAGHQRVDVSQKV